MHYHAASPRLTNPLAIPHMAWKVHLEIFHQKPPTAPANFMQHSCALWNIRFTWEHDYYINITLAIVYFISQIICSVLILQISNQSLLLALVWNCQYRPSGYIRTPSIQICHSNIEYHRQVGIKHVFRDLLYFKIQHFDLTSTCPYHTASLTDISHSHAVACFPRCSSVAGHDMAFLSGGSRLLTWSLDSMSAFTCSHQRRCT